MSHSTSIRRRRAGVVIAGGGLAAQRASETLRRNGYDGAVRVIAREPHAPYDRPPLSKEFLAGELDERALEFRPQPWYAEHDVELLLGERATGLDAPRREVQLAGGGRVPFEQLLIATGSAPRRLAGTERYENVYELRTRDDARALREALSTRPRLIVIGAGFIGQEVAATAKRLGATVTIIEAAATPLEAILGPQLGEWFADFHRREGIKLVLSARIARFHGARAVHAVELEHGRRIGCDLLVVGIGTEPATSWLRDSGLDQGGVRVDAAGRTAIPGIFAAGDASAQFERSPQCLCPHRALGGSSAPRRQRRTGDARPANARRRSAQLLERPARCAHPVRWRHLRRRSARDRRAARCQRLHRTLHPQRSARCGAARRTPTRAPRASPTDSRRGQYQQPREERSMTLIPYIDELACAAHGDCALAAPEVFTIEDIAVVTGTGSDEAILKAAQACPAGAIIVTDEQTGEQIYP